MVLTNVILPIFLIIFLGFLLRRYGKADLKTFSRAQLYVLSPALGFMSLAKPEADTNMILQVLVFMICLQAVLLGRTDRDVDDRGAFLFLIELLRQKFLVLVRIAARRGGGLR